MNKLLGCFLILFLTGCSGSLPPQNTSSPTVELRITSLCELIKDPARFVGKRVRVRSALRFGRHYVDMYSVQCNDHANTTVDYVSSDSSGNVQSCTDVNNILTHPNESGLMGEGTYLIDVEGKLIVPSKPPLMNSFKHTFSAECLHERRILNDLGNGPWALSSEIRKAIELYENEL
ncbi:MAG: hypothetical protein KF685_12960 [Acidobacteria bacterium]|nr:hypothetical protein [Acidobacteriota bacterium]